MVENNFCPEINLNKREIILLIYISFVVLPINQTYFILCKWRFLTQRGTHVYLIVNSPLSLSLIMNFFLKSVEYFSSKYEIRCDIDIDARSLWALRSTCDSPTEPKPLCLTHVHDSEVHRFAQTLYSEQSQEFIVLQWF